MTTSTIANANVNKAVASVEGSYSNKIFADSAKMHRFLANASKAELLGFQRKLKEAQKLATVVCNIKEINYWMRKTNEQLTAHFELEKSTQGNVLKNVKMTPAKSLRGRQINNEIYSNRAGF